MFFNPFPFAETLRQAIRRHELPPPVSATPPPGPRSGSWQSSARSRSADRWRHGGEPEIRNRRPTQKAHAHTSGRCLSLRRRRPFCLAGHLAAGIPGPKIGTSFSRAIQAHFPSASAPVFTQPRNMLKQQFSKYPFDKNVRF